MALTTVWKRRALLAGGALAVFGWVKGAPHLASLGRPDFVFEDIPDLPPFRRLRGTGSATSGAAIFAGLDVGKPENEAGTELKQMVRGDPCTAFFGRNQGDAVPIAMFSDFACPICRIMDDRLAELEESDAGTFYIVRHQLPILGAASETASRAVLAADLQGAYRDMHARLIRSPAVTDERYIAAIADDLGLDQDRLLADMRSDAIDRRLRMTAAIADVFGFFGTPAFAIGRTVFMGSVPTNTLRQLVTLEANKPCLSA
ncbi:DSBA-like thioredoxin domain protein [Rhodobacteraceae bacterium THAF1]|uniref:DsbA family protein n=1 Tax=Palleronia sp. THAF1 TaxID=2587842 RepID=UPI000F3F358B|nr:DsbA family protein [Palleronia sp. THAF1]QFU07208.1 DSBA-like thioredoxin domain protein [Palleronia sp. THAF1]VDC20927.1 DSBA-like thioredoxin domain protein [Rhodobacteraceae bacterium THAF1]